MDAPPRPAWKLLHPPRGSFCTGRGIIGALLALVPAPLGFGTVALEDGPCLGFLAESQGMAGAPDITALGGWRAWLAAQRPENGRRLDERC
jgi:hypothetical protein